jgi:hypothetical protein
MVCRARFLALALTAAVLVMLTGSPGSGARSAVASDPIDRALLYSCGSTPFPLSALQGPADDLNARKPWAKGLRGLLASRSFVVPQRRQWRLLLKTKHTVQYAAGKPAKGLAWVELRRHRGAWTFSTSAFGCFPSAYAPGVGPATWWLGPSSQPGGDSTSFTAQVLEQSCASGQSSAGRVLEPRIEYGPTQIVVTFWVTPAPGDSQTCQGNPPSPYTVQLSEPAQGRALLDGGVFPFRQRFPVIEKRR